MAKASKTPAAKNKKALKREVEGTLTEIFSDIKDAVGKKKFDKKVKKASKILSEGALKKKDKKDKTKKETPKAVKKVKKTAASKKAPKEAAKPVARKTKKQPKVTKVPSVPTPDQTTI